MVCAVLDVADDAFDVLAGAAVLAVFAEFFFHVQYTSFYVCRICQSSSAAMQPPLRRYSLILPGLPDYYSRQRRRSVIMSLFTIADLHLPGADGKSKSMEVFGRRWADYRARLERGWRAAVAPDDSVVIPGDISWALTLDEARSDLAFIDSLPGQKYIGKGNHDFWWSTAAKMKAFFLANNFNTLNILYNNAYLAGGAVICGSRGWFFDEASQKTVGDVSWEKLVNREEMRLRMSLEEGTRLSAGMGADMPMIAFLHFPPVWGDSVARNIVDLLHEFGIRRCYFGHIHSEYVSQQPFCFEDIEFRLISADHLAFCPIRVFI